VRTGNTRTALAIATSLLLVTAARAQHAQAATQAKPTPAAKNPPAPTHAPQPQFSPLDAWTHVKRGNERAAAARAAREPLPAPAPRPAGAGRHICAVIVCADCDLDVAALLGLPRQDLLLISTPGPFVTPEITALLERAVAEDRLSLVLMLTHTHCTTLDTPAAASPQQDALAQRLALVRAEAERMRTTVDKALLLGQRERLLAASDALQRATGTDTLRVMPGQIDTRSGAITWLHRNADAMPLTPVR
jgi:carbonic anhydrase